MTANPCPEKPCGCKQERKQERAATQQPVVQREEGGNKIIIMKECLGTGHNRKRLNDTQQYTEVSADGLTRGHR